MMSTIDLTCPAEIFRIALPTEEISLYRGETYQLTAVLTPADAGIGTDLTWYSSDMDVVLVSEQGVVSAMGGGSAVITVRTGNGKTADLAVTVKVNPERLLVNAESLLLTVGEQIQLETELLPESTTETGITFSSNHPETVGVEGNGLVSAIAAGEAMITVSAQNDLTVQIPVTVYVPMAGMNLDCVCTTLFADVEGLNTRQITIEAEPADATVTAVSYVSSQPEILTVSGRNSGNHGDGRNA